MTGTDQEIDRHQIALDIEADPAGHLMNGMPAWLGAPAATDGSSPHATPGMVRYVLLALRPGRSCRRSLVGDYLRPAAGQRPKRCGPFGYAMFLHNYCPRWMLRSGRQLDRWIRDGGSWGHPNRGGGERC